MIYDALVIGNNEYDNTSKATIDSEMLELNRNNK